MKLGGLILAAGQSSRMVGGHHKLLAVFENMPLVRKSALTLLKSQLGPILVVTGHRKAEIEGALGGLALSIVYNKNFADGMGSSLACGFAEPGFMECDGILIMLADMPAITTQHINEVISAFVKRGGQGVVRGANHETPGHPVIIPKAMFSLMQTLKGDEGAKVAIAQGRHPIQLIDIGHAALMDVDTNEAVSMARVFLSTIASR